MVKLTTTVATLMLCPIAMAQVQWPQRSVELRPKPDEAQVVATFPFTNSGRSRWRSRAVSAPAVPAQCLPSPASGGRGVGRSSGRGE